MSISILPVTDEAFKAYGRVLTKDYDLTDIIEKMQEMPLPADVVYKPAEEKLERLPLFETMKNSVYGGLPIQIGYCNGHNQFLNGLEYHRSSEINIAATDLILMLGLQQDIEEDYTYDTKKVKAFFIPKGTMVECYATTLHYAPCGVKGDGFRCVVVLPKDTNLNLEVKPEGAEEDPLLVARNKWLIAHEDAKIEGAFVGLVGENLSV